jgi:predicted nucleotidyltransferase
MDNIQTILDNVVLALQDVPGVEAVVLGGSRARGTNQPDSDIDIGIYYHSDHLDLPRLQQVAQQMDDEHRGDLVAPPGGWGKWVNGGAWLVVNNLPLDLILRDTERVKIAVEECENGIVSAHYQPGHPHAFLNTMYRGELPLAVFGNPIR